MQLVAVCVLMAVAALSGGLDTPGLVCDCRVRRKGWTFALHCEKQQDELFGDSCQKYNVPEIPEGYVYIPGYALVKLYGIHMHWSTAKKFCEDEGAQLAIPRNDNEYEQLKIIVETQRADKRVHWAFLGLTDEAKEGEFVGVDGVPPSYVRWGENEPNNLSGLENCVTIDGHGWANDVICWKATAFFCERRLSVTVPASYQWSHLAGRFYKVHSELKNYVEAAEVCRSENATLAVPDTYRRVQVLQSLLERDDLFYLTDFTDEAVEGDFVTGTGRHLRDMEFQLWMSGEPNNADLSGKPENCLALSSKGYLIDIVCGWRVPFICEIAPI